MFERTTTRTVVFARTFRVDGVEHELPAGAYEVATDEEMIPGLSFIAYRRVRTTITPAAGHASAVRQVVTVEPEALDAALALDQSPETNR